MDLGFLSIYLEILFLITLSYGYRNAQVPHCADATSVVLYQAANFPKHPENHFGGNIGT